MEDGFHPSSHFYLIISDYDISYWHYIWSTRRARGEIMLHQHPWFPCDFCVSFFASGGGRKGGKLKYPPEIVHVRRNSN
jgi:hypothetical protein